MKALNYLEDTAFLRQLDLERNKFYWVKIEVLNMQEKPIQTIEGKVLPGSSISIDGNSSVRRTCSITFLADDAENDLTNIDNLLSINKKIKIYTGLNNNIDSRYDDIIWFPQGVFVITQPNISHNNAGCRISLSCKDKMCLLNGECGGNFPVSVTFHEYAQIMGEEYLGSILDNLIIDSQDVSTTWTRKFDSFTDNFSDQVNNISFINKGRATTESELNQMLISQTGYPTRYSSAMGRDVIDGLTNNKTYGFILLNLEGATFPNDRTLFWLYNENYDIDIEKISVIKRDESITIVNNNNFQVKCVNIDLYLYNGSYDWSKQGIGEFTIQANSSIVINRFANGVLNKIFADTFYSKIHLNVNTEIGQKYLFMFDGYTPTGFNAGQNHFAINSGQEIFYGNINNNPLEDFETYSLTFTANSNQIDIIFNFTDMINITEAVQLKIRNLRLFEGDTDNVSPDVLLSKVKRPNNYTVYSYEDLNKKYYKTWDKVKGWTDATKSLIGTIVDVPQLIYDIIKTAVCNYGGEALSNIFISDVPLEIKQLVRYTGSKTLWYNTATGVYTLNENYVVNDGTENWRPYSYNEDVGYKYTDFIYPGELVSNIGDNVCTILDKIKTTLGSNFEYFYDVQGKFHFQEKKNYLNNSYNQVDAYRLDNYRKVEIEDNDLCIIDGTNYAVDFNSSKKIAYDFEEGNELIQSYTNTPVYSNLKNDFHIWGENDNKMAIHYHLVIKKKPDMSKVESRQVVFYKKNDEYTGALRLAVEDDDPGDIEEYTPDDWRAELYLRGLEKQKLKQRPDIYEQELLDLFNEIYDFKKKSFKTDMVYRPNNLTYFFDYLEPINSLDKCSVDALGTRLYSYKQDKLNRLYNVEIPNNIMINIDLDETTYNQIVERCEREGQVYSNISPDVNKMISLGTVGYSAQEVAQSMLYQYTNYNESITIQCLPIYYLDVNTRISLLDKKAGIYGDYIIKSITMPIGFGSMSINATKVQREEFNKLK